MMAEERSPVQGKSFISPRLAINSSQASPHKVYMVYLNAIYALFWIQILDPEHVIQGLNSFPNSHLASVTQPADTENN